MSALSQLFDEHGRRGALAQRREAAGGVDGGRLEKLAEFVGRARVEAGVGAAGEAGKLAKGALDGGVAPFLKHEEANAEKPERAGAGGKVVEHFLLGVAD